MSLRHHEARFQFFLTESCDIAPTVTAIQCLRTANTLLDQSKQLTWRVLSETGTDIVSETGLTLRVDAALSSLEPTGNLFLNLGPTVSDTLAQALAQRLHSAKCAYSRVGALSASSVELLARKRVIAGRQVVVHWNREAPLRESFPEITLGNNAYAIDRGLYTASGGTRSTEDLFLAILAEDFGEEFATDVADVLYVDTTRVCGSPVRRSLLARLGRGNEAIATIVRGMEAHVEETVSLRMLATQAGVSTRHAERLFRKYLGKTPLQYYLAVRLEHAKRLLVYTDLTLSEVALASGFKHSSTFHKKYFQHFGIRPIAERGLINGACRDDLVRTSPGLPQQRVACQ